MILVSLAIISCGDNKQEQGEEDKMTVGGNNSTEATGTSGDQNRSATTSEASSDQDVVEIRLNANDQMRFDKNEIRVKAGQTVRLTLEHVGQMPKNAMGHNFVLLEQGTDISEFGQAAAQSGTTEYIPEEYKDQVIANTRMLGGGESATIEFEAPEAGTYDFICSFPGHFALMQGKFIVE